MQRAILILSVAVPAAILVLMVRIILRDWRDIEALTVSPSPLLLLVSLILGLANLATLCFIWRSLLSCLDGGARTIPLLTLIKVFMQSWFARYLPGKIWTLAGRVYLGTRHGIPAEALSVSAFLEFSLSIAAQGALALAAAMVLFRGMLGLSLMTLAFFSACLLGAIALLHPAFTGRLLNAGFRRLGMASLNLHGVVTLSMLLRFFCAYGIAALLLTGSFVSLVASVMENASLDGVTTGGAFIIAHFVGRLVFILPAGLGIREGLLSLFLGTTLPLSAAAFAAVASRGWFVLIDLVRRSRADRPGHSWLREQQVLGEDGPGVPSRSPEAAVTCAVSLQESFGEGVSGLVPEDGAHLDSAHGRPGHRPRVRGPRIHHA